MFDIDNQEEKDIELLFNAFLVIAEKCKSKDEILKAFRAIKEGAGEDLQR